MRRIIYKCAYGYCKKTFFPLFGREEIQRYCSQKCRKLNWKYRNRKKENDWQRKRWKQLHPIKIGSKFCIVCQEVFESDSKHPYQRYCSQKCRNKIHQTTHKKRLYREKYNKKHSQEIRLRNHYYKAKTRFGITSKTLNRRLVLERDKELCKLCNEPYQVVHHIRYSGKLEDLVCLCRACHAGLHQKIKCEPYWID